MTSPPASRTAADADPHVFTVDEAAKLLRISRGLAFAAVRTGTLPHLRIGRRILIPRVALHAYLGMPVGTDPATTAASGDDGLHDRDASARKAAETEAELRELANRLQALVETHPIDSRTGR